MYSLISVLLSPQLAKEADVLRQSDQNKQVLYSMYDLVSHS